MYDSPIHNYFKKEIEASLKSTFFSDNKAGIDLNHLIEELILRIDNKQGFEDLFAPDQKRLVFDKGVVDLTLQIFWYTAIQKDSPELYLYTLNAMSWKKYSELSNAIAAQNDYLKEFKPVNVGCLAVENLKNYPTLSLNAPNLIYCVESNKNFSHKLVSNSHFSTNSLDIYEFLNTTDNYNLFKKIMTKNIKNFGIQINNRILSCANKDSNNKICNYIYEAHVDNLGETANQLKKGGFPIISAFIYAKHLDKTITPKSAHARVKI